MVTPLGATQHPTICFQLLDQVFAVHGGYCTHRKEFCNLRLLTLARPFQPGDWLPGMLFLEPNKGFSRGGLGITGSLHEPCA